MLKMEAINIAALQTLCQRHNEKAYLLCIEQNCNLPILICNQCIEDDHAHISVPIKKLKTSYQQKSRESEETDELTGKISTIYQDFKESIIQTIDEDQNLFIKQICANKASQLPEMQKQTIEKLNNSQFQNLKSSQIRALLKSLQSEPVPNPKLEDYITSRLNSRRNFFENIKNQLKGVSINNNWEFVTLLGQKVRKGDKYCLMQGNNLVGNIILPNHKNKIRWKITFNRFDLFSCIGFGVGNRNTLKEGDVSKNSIICCVCCNGPWAGKSLQLIQSKESKFLKDLLNEDHNSIVLEVDRINDVFAIYGPTNKLFGKKALGQLKGQDDLVPIVKNASNIGIQFVLQTLQ